MDKSLRIKSLYKDIYSALYEWNLKRWSGDEETASFLTAVGLTAALMMNTLLVIGVVVAVHGPLPPTGGDLLTVGLLAAYALLNYAVFIRHNQYVDIIRHFRAKPVVQRRRAAVVAWLYLVASFVLPLGFFGIMAVATGQ